MTFFYKIILILTFLFFSTSEASQPSKAIVVTANNYASEAAAKIIKRGGTAADAAVTAQLILTMTTPQSTGIGGGNLFATAMSGGKFSFGVPSNVDTTNTNGVGIFSFGLTSTTNDKVDDSVKASGNNTDDDDAQSTISSNVSDL